MTTTSDEEDDIYLEQATCIDYYNIYATCNNPKCKDIFHLYGSGEDVSNRFEYRLSHCEKFARKIKIRIDETSERCTMRYFRNKSITISRNKFLRQKEFFEKKKRIKESMKDGKYVVKFE